MNHAYYHRDQGRREKPVLLMIPGVVASLHTWACLRAAFAPHDRIIRFDVTGSARDGEYSAELGLLLDYLRVEGGYRRQLAWWRYRQVVQPQRVGKLVLIDPAGYPMTKVLWMIAAAALPGATLAMPMWMPRALIAQRIKEVYGDPGRIKPGVVDCYYDLSRSPGNRRAMMDVFRVLLRVNKTELVDMPQWVAQIQAPTLLMRGVS